MCRVLCRDGCTGFHAPPRISGKKLLLHELKHLLLVRRRGRLAGRVARWLFVVVRGTVSVAGVPLFGVSILHLKASFQLCRCNCAKGRYICVGCDPHGMALLFCVVEPVEHQVC